MSNSILDLVGQQLGGNGVSQISQQIGSDPSSTAQAIQMALPMLVGGLAHNAQSPQGAAALDSALDSHDPGLLDNVAGLLGGGGGGGGGALAGALGGMLGGGGASGGGGLGGMLGSLLAGGAGAGILGHVLGGRRPAVEQGIGRATGMNQGQVAQLLLLLAPLVMSALARRRQEAQSAGGGSVSDVLQQERRQVDERSPDLGGLLGKVFGGGAAGGAGGVDRDGDGIADDIGRVNPGSLGGILGGLLGGR